MSSTLAMILAAGMTVPGDVPKEASGEVEERLDLSGKWEGTCEDGEGQSWEALLVGPVLYLTQRSGGNYFSTLNGWEGFDEGKGKVRIKLAGPTYLGIYKHEDNRTIICYRIERRGRPTSFRAGNGQNLLILHRVKPGK